MLLIPGPVSCTESVIDALGRDSLSHTGAEFASVFQRVIINLRKLFNSSKDSGSLPIVLAGSGTLGFDLIGSNLCPTGKEKLLLLSTGYFSDELGECLSEFYRLDVTVLSSEQVGGGINLDVLAKMLQETKYDLVLMTHVDTSTGVLNDIEKISGLVHSHSPDSLVVVDAVCSLGCESIEFDKWGLDFVFSASQKALGAPPGLSVSIISDRALKVALKEIDGVDAPPRPYFTSLKKWVPSIESYEAGGKVHYFATPPIQLILSLDVALKELLGTDYVTEHLSRSNWLKQQVVEDLKLKLVTLGPIEKTAHGLAAIYVSNPPEVMKRLQGIDIAGGIHPAIKTKYIRIGLMGRDATEENLSRILRVVQEVESESESQ